MAKKSSKSKSDATEAPPERSGPTGITKITVRDFKSLAGEHSIEVRPLTILAGANSSGKSSIMQPLLLMKQTLEANYDPGPLRLDGANAKFTSSDQFLTRTGSNGGERAFSAGIEVDGGLSVESTFALEGSKGLAVVSTTYLVKGQSITLKPTSDPTELVEAIGSFAPKPLNGYLKSVAKNNKLAVRRDNCFLTLKIVAPTEGRDTYLPFPFMEYFFNFNAYINGVIHLPGLRGNPQRTYPVSAVGPTFPGAFEQYTASVVFHWHGEDRSQPLEALFADLRHLGLTWKVTAKQVDETRIELQVGRLTQPARGGAHDMVSIADVGFGVSQTLPVLVAMHIARPGQLVYIEQPEIHLHPRAQTAMAGILANAAMRGVRLVVETHSELLLLGIQTLVAEKKLSPNLVKLHWFERDREGSTHIKSADLDEQGAFGDWPDDFGDVQLKAQSAYLDAAEIWSEAR